MGGVSSKNLQGNELANKNDHVFPREFLITAIYLYVDADIVEGWWDILNVMLICGRCDLIEGCQGEF